MVSSNGENSFLFLLLSVILIRQVTISMQTDKKNNSVFVWDVILAINFMTL